MNVKPTIRNVQVKRWYYTQGKLQFFISKDLGRVKGYRCVNAPEMSAKRNKDVGERLFPGFFFFSYRSTPRVVHELYREFLHSNAARTLTEIINFSFCPRFIFRTA